MPPKDAPSSQDPNAVEFGLGTFLGQLGGIVNIQEDKVGESVDEAKKKGAGFLEGLLSVFSGEGSFMDKIGALFSMLFKPIMDMLGFGGGNEVAQTPPQTPTAPTAPEQAHAPESAPTVAPQQTPGIVQQLTNTVINEALSTIPLPDMIKQPLAKLVISNVNDAAATHLPALQTTQPQKTLS